VPADQRDGRFLLVVQVTNDESGQLLQRDGPDPQQSSAVADRRQQRVDLLMLGLERIEDHSCGWIALAQQGPDAGVLPVMVVMKAANHRADLCLDRLRFGSVRRCLGGGEGQAGELLTKRPVGEQEELQVRLIRLCGEQIGGRRHAVGGGGC
jgi:hypothetical protein